MKRLIVLLVCIFTLSHFSCSGDEVPSLNVLNGVWELAERDFSKETRIKSKYKWGNAEIIPLHSYVFFIESDEKVFVTQNEVFIINSIESLSPNRIKIVSYLLEGTKDNLYTYVFKVLDDTTIEFLAEESSTPLFPARLKKGGEVYP
jgi:hypothetical protein